jgi:hypothetical protein
MTSKALPLTANLLSILGESYGLEHTGTTG